MGLWCVDLIHLSGTYTDIEPCSLIYIRSSSIPPLDIDLLSPLPVSFISQYFVSIVFYSTSFRATSLRQCTCFEYSDGKKALLLLQLFCKGGLISFFFFTYVFVQVNVMLEQYPHKAVWLD